jgi:hypothetical protein
MSDFKPEPLVIAINYFLNGLESSVSMTGPTDIDGTVFPLDAFSSTHVYGLCYSPQDATRLMIPPICYAALHGLNAVIYSLFGLSKQNGQLQDDQLQENLDFALFLALFSGHRKTADLLLDLGANPGRELSSNGLHGAASRGLKEEIYLYIREFEVWVDAVDQNFATPVMYAMQLNEPHDWDTIEYLFRLGADPHTEVEVGEGRWTYAQYARAMGKEDLAKRLEGADAASPTCYALSRESSYAIGQD